MIKSAFATLMLCVILATTAPPSRAARLRVVTDIAPVAAVVHAVLGDEGDVVQLVRPFQTSHDFSLRPSDIAALQRADLIVWMGPRATPGLKKIMFGAQLAAKSITLNALAETRHLPMRKSGVFGPSGDHTGALSDPHTWLDPANAAAWASRIASALIVLAPQASAAFSENDKKFKSGLLRQSASIQTSLSSLPTRPFVQYHDAFQYFEVAFGLNSLGSATAADQETTSLGTMARLQRALAHTKSPCVFVANDQMAARAGPLLELPGARKIVIDVLGRNLPDDAYSYRDLLGSVAAGFTDCFSNP